MNVVLLSGMIWSGLLIYWAHDVYQIRIGDRVLFRFFPEWFYRIFGLSSRLAEGMAWHFTLMWGFALNGLAYVAYTFISGEWRHLVPNRKSLREAWMVVLHDLHLSSVEPPRRKFNGAQQFAYTGVILMGAGSLLTGLAIYKPVQFAWMTTVLGGYEWARLEHFALTIGYVLFFLMHITQVIRAGWNNFRAMVIGYEVVAEPTPQSELTVANSACHPGSIFQQCLCGLLVQALSRRQSPQQASMNQDDVWRDSHVDR